MTRILFVADDPGIALGLGDTLGLEGHDVEVVVDGATASERTRQQTFDLIVLGVMLPERTDGKRLPFVAREEASLVLKVRSTDGDEERVVFGLRRDERTNSIAWSQAFDVPCETECRLQPRPGPTN